MKNAHIKTLSMSLLLALSLSMVGCNKVTNYNLHTEDQTAYLEGDYNLISLYASGREELSRPGVVTLDWDDFSNKTYNVSVSKNKNFEGELAKSYETGDSRCVLYNLEINETYYWYAFNDDGKTKVQSLDKKLELELDRLETERNALQTEIDAVSKVLKDNVEKTFNTFN